MVHETGVFWIGWQPALRGSIWSADRLTENFELTTIHNSTKLLAAVFKVITDRSIFRNSLVRYG